jgi:PRTRC genetic system protein B
MIGISTELHGNTAALNSAILIYGKRSGYNNGVAFATVHDVDTGPTGRPMVAPGRLIAEADLAALYSGLNEAQGAQSGVQWLDSRVLASGAGRLIWWSPPGQRPLFFKQSESMTSTFTASAVCPVPGLVWMLRDTSLSVYAVAGSDRPTLTTALFQAPFFNVWATGEVCVGSATPPSKAAQHDPAAWEGMFFGSNFTHPNVNDRNRLVKAASAVSFWRKMVQAKQPVERFPEDALVSLPLKVEDLLAIDVNKKITAIGRGR